MNEWCVFWICLFTYWTIKESVAMITYNQRQAIKDLVKKEYGRRISELVDEKVTDADDEIDSDEMDEIYEELEKIDNKEK